MASAAAQQESRAQHKARRDLLLRHPDRGRPRRSAHQAGRGGPGRTGRRQRSHNHIHTYPMHTYIHSWMHIHGCSIQPTIHTITYLHTYIHTYSLTIVCACSPVVVVARSGLCVPAAGRASSAEGPDLAVARVRGNHQAGAGAGQAPRGALRHRHPPSHIHTIIHTYI